MTESFGGIFKIITGPCCIKRETLTRYLGVYLDEKLTWREHIKQVCEKFVKVVRAFHSLSRKIYIVKCMRLEIMVASSAWLTVAVTVNNKPVPL